MKKTHHGILIVDDNLSFIERVIRLLNDVENIGSIKIATSYNEAFTILNNEKKDIVLLDINLNGKSGIELLERIREKMIPCKVIMISNHSDDYYKRECKALGADYFLDKTNDFNKLPEIIENLQVV